MPLICIGLAGKGRVVPFGTRDAARDQRAVLDVASAAELHKALKQLQVSP